MPNERFMQHYYGASGFVKREDPTAVMRSALNGIMDELSRQERNWRPEACPQCGSIGLEIIRTWMGKPTCEQEAGVCWQVHCGSCGGIFEIRLLESITINTEIKQKADKQIGVEQKPQTWSGT